MTVILQHITVFIICRKPRKHVHFSPSRVQAPSFQKGLFYLLPPHFQPTRASQYGLTGLEIRVLVSRDLPGSSFMLQYMVVVIVLCMSLSLQPWAHCQCPFNTSLQTKSWPFAFSDVQIFRQAEQLEFALNWWAQLWSQAYICEQQPNCSVDNCILSGWLPLLI